MQGQQGQCYPVDTPHMANKPYALEERAVLESIHILEKSIAEMAGLLTDLEKRLDVARRHLPHPEIAEEKIQSGSELSGMIAAKTSAIGDLAYRMRNLLDELEI